VNVGNTIRFIYFEFANAAGARVEADWPDLMNILINNDLWNTKTATTGSGSWQDYGLTGARTPTPPPEHWTGLLYPR